MSSFAPSIDYLKSDRSWGCDVFDHVSETFQTAGDVIGGVCALLPKNSGEVASAISGSQTTLSCFRSFIAIQTLVSLKCVYGKTESDKVELKHYLVIALGVCIVAARLLSLASNMHALKLVNMSRYINRINQTINHLFSLVVLINFANAIRGYNESVKPIPVLENLDGDEVDKPVVNTIDHAALAQKQTDAKVNLTQATGHCVVQYLPFIPAAVIAPAVVTAVSLVASTVIFATLLYQAKDFRRD